MLAAVYLANRLKLLTLFLFLVPFLLCGALALGTYSEVLFHRSWGFFTTRNWLFTGIPYFTIGMLIKKYLPTVSDRWNHVLIAATLLLWGIGIVEKNWIESVGRSPVGDLFLSTTPIAIALFLCFNTLKTKTSNWLSDIGLHDSLYIYIFHIAVAKVILAIMGLMVDEPKQGVFEYAGFFLVLLFTMAASRLFRWAMRQGIIRKSVSR